MTNSYKFDDEKGNTFNLTVNHYHMAQHNPMSNMMNMIALASIMKPKENLVSIEHIGRDIGYIESSSTEQAEYEIIENKFEELSIQGLSKKHDIVYLDIDIGFPVIRRLILEEYKDFVEIVKEKMSHISNNTHRFIITIENTIDKLPITIAYTDTTYFTELLKKFNRDSISFELEVAKELQMPFLDSLNEIEYLCDKESILELSYDALTNKYRLTKTVKWVL